MIEILGYTILTLCALGVLSAVILYFVAQKFKVYEDPRIDSVEGMLPGANCGGCGFAGCRGLADALVKNDDISSLYCAPGGADTMKSIATFLGKVAPEKEPQVAVVRCNGTCEHAPRINRYDGAHSCAVAASLYGGETGCTFGCLGKGDCEVVCTFDAIKVNPQTGIPEVDEEKCTACGACVKACPKMIIELRKKGIKSRRVYVACANKDKGALSRKACSVSCIACTKCVKVCTFEAITIESNLAYIDADKCKLCRKCVSECPTGAITEVNFPPKKVVEAPASSTPAASVEKAAPKAEPVKKAEPVVAKADAAPEQKPAATEKIEPEAEPKSEPAKAVAAPVVVAAAASTAVNTVSDIISPSMDEAIKSATESAVESAVEQAMENKE